MADENTQDAPVVSEESIKEAPLAESAETAAEVLTESKPEKKASKEVSGSLNEIIEKIEKLSVLELADLVHALEDKFGVTAAAPMAVAAGPVAAASGEVAEEQTSFDVILTNAGANKIGAIKAVRELVPTLGLKEAKDLVEAAPKPVLEGVNKETANDAKAKLTAAGATVDLK
jgi:large subunit ribosomal protein L7/L12